MCNGNYRIQPMVWDIALERAMATPADLTAFGRFTPEGNYWEYQTPYAYHYCRMTLPATHGRMLEFLQLDNRVQNNFLNMPARLRLRDPITGDIMRAVSGITGQLLDISRDNRKAVTLTGVPRMPGNTLLGTDNTELIVWDLATGKELTRLKGLNGFLVERKAAIFSPDGSKFAAASSTYNAPPDLRVWDTTTGALLHALNSAGGEQPHKNFLQMLAFSADGTQLASGGQDGVAVVWDAEKGSIRKTIKTTGQSVDELAFTPDGKQLLTGSESAYGASTIQLWDMTTGERVREFSGVLHLTASNTSLTPQAVSADGKLLALGAGDHIDLWDLNTGAVRRQFPLPQRNLPLALALNPDASLLFATLDHAFMVWDVATGTVKATLPNEVHEFDNCTRFQVAFSPDGTHAAGCAGNSLLLWNTKDWIVEKHFDDNPGLVDDVAFSPDGMKLAWFSVGYTGPNFVPNGKLVIWDIPANTRNTIESKDFQQFNGLAFSPDGKWLATREGGQVRLWNCMLWKEEKPIRMPATWRGQITFTADSTHLLCTDNMQLVCCDIATGEVKPTALGKVSQSLNIAMTSHGRELITCDVDGTAQLWDTTQLIARKTVEPRATLRSFEKNLWLITTPAGYFDCAPGVMQAIRWKQGEQCYPGGQFEQEYRRPELVRKALQE